MSEEVAEGFCTACLLEDGLTPGDVPEATIPLKQFGDYELLEEIARGGMGVVYRARQISLNRTVAIKMILGGQLAGAAEVARFRTEAETAARLQHPGIVAVHEVGEQEGNHYFSMDYVAGCTLAELVREQPLPARRAAQYARAIAEAIQFAHEQGVLHRDLKPSNVLIDAEDQPRVTDFGLAKWLEGKSELTQTGQVLGSPSFIPPEQSAGKSGPVGPASDVYSLGAILYHLLTGHPPFVAETVTATLRMVAENEPVSPRLLNASVPRDLETICLKCLEKDPQRRYSSAQELVHELGHFLRNEPIHARPAGVVLKVHRWCVRNKPLAIAATAILALLFVVAIGSPLAIFRIDRERRQAQANEQKARTEATRSQQVARFLRDMLKSAGPSIARGRDATVLREILEMTSTRVGNELKDQPEVQGDIYSTIGNTFLDIGDHPRAITNYGLAITSYRTASLGDHVKLAATLSAYGFCQSFRGDIAQGSTNARLGLEMARRCGDSEALFTCLWRYAGSLGSWGGFPAEAEPYLREAFDLKKKRADDPVGLARAMYLYAGFLTNHDEGEKLLRGSLDTFRKHLTSEHPQTVQTIFGLAQHLIDVGRFAEAEPLMAEAFQGFQRIHDPNHPYQAIVTRFLAEALLGQGKDDQAESLVRQQLAIAPTNFGYTDLLNRVVAFRTSFGPDPGRRALLKGDFLGQGLAQWLEQIDDLTAAEDLCRFLVEQRTKSLGPDHAETVNAQFCLATVLLRRGKPADAESVYRDIAKVWRSVPGNFYGRIGLWSQAITALTLQTEKNPDDAEAHRLLAPLLVHAGDVASSQQLRKRIVTRFGDTSDPYVGERMAKALAVSPQTDVDWSIAARWIDLGLARLKERNDLPWFQMGKGLVEYRQGNFAAAADWAQRALQNTTPVPERDAASWLVLAMAQQKLEDHNAAETSLRKGVELMEEKLPRIDSGDLGFLWVDRLVVDLLWREAATLIVGTPPAVRTELRLGNIPLEDKTTVRKEEQWAIDGRNGRLDAAAAALSQSVETSPGDFVPYLRLAAILSLNGDSAKYRQLCQQLVARFAGTTDLGAADTVAKACTLLPDSGVDLKTVAQAAEAAVTLGRQSEFFPWFALCKSLAEYRQEHFPEAATWAQTSLAAAGPLPARDAAAYLVLAMAKMRLNQTEAAREALAKGADLVEQKLPGVDTGYLGNQWVDVVIANILLREAKAIIEGGPIRAPRP